MNPNHQPVSNYSVYMYLTIVLHIIIPRNLEHSVTFQTISIPTNQYLTSTGGTSKFALPNSQAAPSPSRRPALMRWWMRRWTRCSTRSRAFRRSGSDLTWSEKRGLIPWKRWTNTLVDGKTMEIQQIMETLNIFNGDTHYFNGTAHYFDETTPPNSFR